MTHPRLAYLGHMHDPGDEPGMASSALAVQGFVEAGADVRLILRRAGRTRPRDSLESATGVIVPDVTGLFAPRLGRSLLPFYWRAYRQLARSDRNVLLFRDVGFLPWAARLRRRGMLVFFEAHEYWGDSPSRETPIDRSTRRGIERARRWLPSLDGIFCTSGPQVELYRSLFPTLPVEVALIGTRYPRPNERERFAYRLGCFGSVDADHPVRAVIEGLARCGTAEVRLTIVGVTEDAERTRIENLARRLRVADRVDIHGWTRPEERARFRAQIDVGTVPLADTFDARTSTPFELVDHLSASLPTIATRTGSVAAYVTDGREALLVDHSSRAWAEAIDRIYGDFAFYRALSSQALARARELTWTRRSVRMLDIIKRALTC